MKLPMFTTLALCVATTSASAADSSSSESFRLEEIVVTANKVQRSLQDTQTSVAVLRGDTLEQDNVVTLENAIQRVANANIDSIGNLSLRGIDKNGSGGISTNRMVLGVYVDGVAQSYQSQRFASSVWDIDQVEVLRGPVGTVQGRNALAGALVVNTADPEFSWKAKARASYGEDNAYHVAGALTGPIVDDTLAFRFSAERRGGDGDITNTTLGDDEAGRFRTDSYRGKLLFEPSSVPGLRAVLSLSRTESDPAPTQRLVTGDYRKRETISTSAEGSWGENDSASLKVDYELNDSWSLTSITAYSSSETLNLSPFDAADIGNPQRITIGDFDDENTSQEVRLTLQNDRITGVFGVYAAEMKTNQYRAARASAQLLGAPSGDAFLSTRVAETIQNLAAFTDLTFRLTSHWDLLAGARIDREENEFSRNLDGVYMVDAAGQPIATLIPGIPRSTAELSGTEFLPKAGVVYHFNDDISAGYTFSKGYRPGGSGVDVTSAVYSAVTFYEFDAEKTDNHELSLRTSWLDGRFTANANIYYVDWKDQQVVLNGRLSSLDDFVIVNAASSELYGAELELAGRVGGLQLFGSVGYSNTEFQEVNLPQEYVARGFGGGANLSGKEFRLSPKITAAAGASYTWDFGLRASIDASYRDEVYQNSTNTTKIPSYTLTNLDVSYDTSFGSVFIYANNVFDEEAISLYVPSVPANTWLRDGRNVGVGFQANCQ